MSGARKPGSRSRGGGSGRKIPERRMPPPEVTRREAEYFRQRAGSGAFLVVHLASGGTVSGTLARFDRDVITLGRGDASDVVVRKSDIRYIEERGSG